MSDVEQLTYEEFEALSDVEKRDAVRDGKVRDLLAQSGEAAATEQHDVRALRSPGLRRAKA